MAELTLDHILPRSRGGDNSPVNIVTACIACNNRKRNRTPEEARMPLLTSQSALRVKLERVVCLNCPVLKVNRVRALLR